METDLEHVEKVAAAIFAHMHTTKPATYFGDPTVDFDITSMRAEGTLYEVTYCKRTEKEEIKIVMNIDVDDRGPLRIDEYYTSFENKAAKNK